ncbi:MAG: hypothetical protein L6R42_000315 [Xanthoria sp. 1 TBL-2021]|nr:MAG: hypothetical protein L6R42_000315 [Xanthoria sp. 1 TBL-2021]
MSQFHWPLLRETSFGLPPGSTMDLLPKSPANSPGGSPHEHRAKEARETFFEGYSKLDKGTVAGLDNMGSQCDLRFLQTIWQNIRYLRRCMMLDMQYDQNKFPDVDLAIPTLLDETCVELKRLIEHPEILPQGTGRFLELMEGELELLLGSVQLKQTEGHGLQEAVKQHRKQILAAYDENRTTWQQFLHDQAPGSGFPKEQMHQHGCTQMATAACQLLRPAPKEPARLGENMSLQSLADRYPRLAKRWTRVRLRPQTYRANLVNELAITDMRRLIKLAEARDRT